MSSDVEAAAACTAIASILLDTNRAILMGAIDNLVKGAAGQAVQNMNLMFGLSETAGLDLVPLFP